MRFSADQKKLCPDMNREVNVVAFVEAQGGFGCAVAADGVTYECELQDTCPVYKSGRCSLEQ